MGKSTTKINLKPIIPLLDSIKKRFKPEKIILFGSRAKGYALKESDYDLLVVSVAFAKVDMYQRMVDIYHLQTVPITVDVICLTPKEFDERKRSIGIIHDAIKEGIDITSAI